MFVVYIQPLIQIILNNFIIDHSCTDDSYLAFLYPVSEIIFKTHTISDVYLWMTKLNEELISNNN